MNGLVLEGVNRSATFFGTVGAKITLETRGFFFSDAEYDRKNYTKGYSVVLPMNEYIIIISNVASFFSIL
jgi:hypothetical protein